MTAHSCCAQPAGRGWRSRRRTTSRTSRSFSARTWYRRCSTWPPAKLVPSDASCTVWTRGSATAQASAGACLASKEPHATDVGRDTAPCPPYDLTSAASVLPHQQRSRMQQPRNLPLAPGVGSAHPNGVFHVRWLRVRIRPQRAGNMGRRHASGLLLRQGAARPRQSGALFRLQLRQKYVPPHTSVSESANHRQQFRAHGVMIPGRPARLTRCRP
jgi:hypothetical protein